MVKDTPPRPDQGFDLISGQPREHDAPRAWATRITYPAAHKHHRWQVFTPRTGMSTCPPPTNWLVLIFDGGFVLTVGL